MPLNDGRDIPVAADALCLEKVGFSYGRHALNGVSMRVGRGLLVAALMVLPVGAAVAGLAVARAAGLAPGGTIVLVASGAFALTAMLDLGRRRVSPLS